MGKQWSNFFLHGKRNWNSILTKNNSRILFLLQAVKWVITWIDVLVKIDKLSYSSFEEAIKSINVAILTVIPEKLIIFFFGMQVFFVTFMLW